MGKVLSSLWKYKFWILLVVIIGTIYFGVKEFVGSYERRLEERGDKIEELSSERDNLDASLSAANSRIEVFMTLLENKESTLADSKRDNEKLQDVNEEIRKDIDRLEQQLRDPVRREEVTNTLSMETIESRELLSSINREINCDFSYYSGDECNE